MNETTRRFKVVTYNVYHGYPRCHQIETRLGLLERELAAESPDVVILQEMSNSELYGHLAERLVDGLRGRGLTYSMIYEPANGSLRDAGVFEEGSAILSRWPITGSECRRLAAAHEVRREYHGFEYQEFRIALRATLEIGPEVALDVFGAHITDAEPQSATSPRRLQIEDLAAFVTERPSHALPAIIGGDFNAAPESSEIAWLRRSGFYDLCAESEPGPTNDRNDRDLENPVDTADQRVDYLFVAPRQSPGEQALRQAQGERRDVRVLAVRRFLDRAFELEPGRFLWVSDHSGILAEFELPLQPLPPSSS